MKPGIQKGSLEYDNLIANTNATFVLKHGELDAAESSPIKRGTVLGRVSAGKKFKVCKDANGDGSEVAVAILADDFDGGSEKIVPIYLAGSFNEDSVIFDGGLADKEAVIIALHGNSIFLS